MNIKRPDIVCLEGNGSRPSHHGDGWNFGAMYTLNSTEVHIVCYRADINRTSSERFQGDDNGSLPDAESEDGNRRRERPISSDSI